MSNIDFTANLLQLKDPNLTFFDMFSQITKKDTTYNIIFAMLSYSPDFCPHCGSANDSSIIKYGFKSSDIKLLACNGFPTILRLKKQRFLCKECMRTFIAESDIVNKHCFISNQVKLKLLDQLRLKISEKDIASMNFVSHSTVSKAVDNAFCIFKPRADFLPSHLLFDEFKSTRDAKGAMSFIIADADSHQIIDIVENRQLPFLKQYFSKFSNDAKAGVQTICIDMYSPYISLIKETFPNAVIILDRFHIIQLLSRALNRTRIEAMSSFPTYSMEYKRLKRYWKLILKRRSDIDALHFKYAVHFKGWISKRDIVDKSICCDAVLQNTYNAYQNLLTDFENGNTVFFKRKLIALLEEYISDYMKTAIRSLLDNFEYVKNAMIYDYSNGAIEGINNLIKTIKRVAFGYKSFFHFRNRILIITKLMYPK